MYLCPPPGSIRSIGGWSLGDECDAGHLRSKPATQPPPAPGVDTFSTRRYPAARPAAPMRPEDFRPGGPSGSEGGVCRGCRTRAHPSPGGARLRARAKAQIRPSGGRLRPRAGRFCPTSRGRTGARYSLMVLGPSALPPRDTNSDASDCLIWALGSRHSSGVGKRGGPDEREPIPGTTEPTAGPRGNAGRQCAHEIGLVGGPTTEPRDPWRRDGLVGRQGRRLPRSEHRRRPADGGSPGRSCRQDGIRRLARHRSRWVRWYFHASAAVVATFSGTPSPGTGRGPSPPGCTPL
jgi:hypothetical protein